MEQVLKLFEEEVFPLLVALRRGDYIWDNVNCNKKELKKLEKKLASHFLCGKLVQTCNSSGLTVREKDYCKRMLQAQKHNLPLTLSKPEDLDTIIKKISQSKLLELSYTELCNGRKVLYCYSPDQYFGVHHWLVGCCLENGTVKLLTVFFLFPSRKPLAKFLKTRKSKRNEVKKILLHPLSPIPFL